MDGRGLRRELGAPARPLLSSDLGSRRPDSEMTVLAGIIEIRGPGRYSTSSCATLNA